MCAEKQQIVYTAIFDQNISEEEIPLFRGAIIHMLDNRQNLLCHNHLDSDKFRYSYPLVQYKIIDGKAAVVALNEGITLVRELCSSPSIKILLGSREVTLGVAKQTICEFSLNIASVPFRYRLKRWLPLNSQNYKVYRFLHNDVDRMELLERILKGNMLSFAKGLGHTVDQLISAHILNVSATYKQRNKQTLLMAFDIEFETNFMLPDYVGLGKNASIGYGWIEQADKSALKSDRVFLLGGNDLEMDIIRQLLIEHSCVFFDKNLMWDNARLSAYSDVLTLWNDKEFVGIELEADVDVPARFIDVNHHNDRSVEKSSVEQVAELLGVSLNRYQRLVAANDKGHIAAMKDMGATEAEIVAIRQEDRRCQGVSRADEDVAEKDVSRARVVKDTVLVKTRLTHFSPIVDRLTSFQKIIVYSEQEMTYYGNDCSRVIELFQDELKEEKAYFGGSPARYFGIKSGVMEPEEIVTCIQKILDYGKDL